MSELPLIEDAYRLAMDLWGAMNLPPATSLTIEAFRQDDMVAEVKFKPGGVDVWIRLNPDYVDTGEELHLALLHELLHVMDRDTLLLLRDFRHKGGLPKYALEMLLDAEEGFIIRLERFVAKILPCPEWLSGLRYDKEGNYAAE